MAERFLDDLAPRLEGPARDRERLREELAAHLDDARERGLSDQEAVALLGTPEAIAAAWNARCARRRAQQRVRAASVAAVTAAAALLAVVQYAQGAPSHPAPPTLAPCTRASPPVTTPRRSRRSACAAGRSPTGTSSPPPSSPPFP